MNFWDTTLEQFHFRIDNTAAPLVVFSKESHTSLVSPGSASSENALMHRRSSTPRLSHDERKRNHAECGNGEESNDIDVRKNGRLLLHLLIHAEHGATTGSSRRHAARRKAMRQGGSPA